MRTIPTEKQAMALFGSVMTGGIAEMIRKKWPVKAITNAIWMVLNRPQYLSAMYAPSNGVTYDHRARLISISNLDDD
jgi:hypothetical protein